MVDGHSSPRLARQSQRMAPLLALLAVGAVGGVVTAVACAGVPEAELLEGKACTAAGECASGYLCDRTQNICVPAGSLPSAGSGGAAGTSGVAGATGGVAGVSGVAGIGGEAAAASACDDVVQNGNETDIDCGGTECQPCEDDAACRDADDCTSRVCTSEVCQEPACTDSVQNGNESDVDCGGAACPKCLGGQACLVADDCLSGDCASGVCTMCPPGMVEIPVPEPSSPPPSYCVDQYEVTQADYQAFLNAKGSNMSGQPSYCSWNQTFQPVTNGTATNCSPSSFDPIATPNHPAVCVDWCDAYAYCHWAGKRLCGLIGSGENAWGSYADATTNEWNNACSSGGTFVYPYGNTYDAEACNQPGTGTVAVGSSVLCHSPTAPFSELYDFAGNARVWVNACDGETGIRDDCYRRGGGYNSQATSTPCDYAYADPRDTTRDAIGVRCCADAATRCSDGILNGSETDVDCGGDDCHACADGLECLLASDCTSEVCTDSICRVPTCTDGILNGAETDLDCGGNTGCPRCVSGQQCQRDSDCEGWLTCQFGICAA